MARTTPITFRVRLHGCQDTPALLDMLRYEGGQVMDWGYASGDTSGRAYTVTIRVEDHYRHQPDRWRSFGLTPETVA